MRLGTWVGPAAETKLEKLLHVVFQGTVFLCKGEEKVFRCDG